MFCTKCGNQLRGNEKFCSKCGATVDNQHFVKETNTRYNKVANENSKEPFAENEILATLNKNIFFKELLNPSGRRNRKKYIIVFIVIFFIFYMAGTMMSYRAPAIRNTIASIVRWLMIIICFVNLCKRLHDSDHTAGWAFPILGFSYLFYYIMLPHIYYDMFFAYSRERKFLQNMAYVCMVLTVLPHVLIYFVKGTKGANQYGGED